MIRQAAHGAPKNMEAELKIEYVETALEIALKAHKGQKDKAGQPYIFHPMRLAAQFDRFDYKAAAYLHDALEDSSITAAQLLEAGIPDYVVEVVELLTFRGPKTDYEYFKYIKNVRRNPMARDIKRADLLDNLDPRRLAKLDKAATLRIERYHCALRIVDFLED